MNNRKCLYETLKTRYNVTSPLTLAIIPDRNIVLVNDLVRTTSFLQRPLSILLQDNIQTIIDNIGKEDCSDEDFDTAILCAILQDIIEQEGTDIITKHTWTDVIYESDGKIHLYKYNTGGNYEYSNISE